MRVLTVRERDILRFSGEGKLTSGQEHALGKLAPVLPRGALTWERSGVRVGPFCGVLRAGDLVLEILPKIEVGASVDAEARGVLVAMLRATGDLAVSNSGTAWLGLLNGDAKEEVTFKFRFGEPRHGDGSEHTHIQPFVVRKATGDDALRGDAGESLVEGETGSVATGSDLRVYVGIAPELFAANAGFRTFMTAFYKDQRFDADAILLDQRNPFARRNVTAIVLEVPSELIGKGKINAWTTISLLGHAPEVQVSRWGLPMVTHLFLDDPSDQELKEQFNASVPSEDLERFARSIADFAEKMTIYVGSAADPGEYGKLIAARLCPNTLPYELGTFAAFEVASFNGRALGDDALDVMLTLAANTPLVDGLAPDRGRIRKDFPYYGAPYTAEEQVGVRPMPRPVKK